MTRYSLQRRDQILEKGYEFLPFARNIGKNVGKNLSKNLSSKYSEKLLYNAKQSATDVFKTASKIAIQETAEATGNLIGNENADKITRVSNTLPKNKWKRNT